MILETPVVEETPTYSISLEEIEQFLRSVSPYHRFDMGSLFDCVVAQALNAKYSPTTFQVGYEHIAVNNGTWLNEQLPSNVTALIDRAAEAQKGLSIQARTLLKLL